MDPLRQPGATGTPSALLGLAESLETNRSIDGARRALFGAARRLLPGPVKHALQGRAAGHAAHPISATIPIGTFVSAAALDWFAPDAEDAATLLTGLSVASALPAAATGAAEAVDADPETQRVATVHAGCNAVGTVLAGASLAARLAGAQTAGKLLLLGAGTAWGVGGYLGGHLSIVRKYGTHGIAG